MTLGGRGGAGEEGGGGGGLGAEPVVRPWSSMAMASLRPTLSRPPVATVGAMTGRDENEKEEEKDAEEEENRSFFTGPF